MGTHVDTITIPDGVSFTITDIKKSEAPGALSTHKEYRVKWWKDKRKAVWLSDMAVEGHDGYEDAQAKYEKKWHLGAYKWRGPQKRQRPSKWVQCDQCAKWRLSGLDFAARLVYKIPSEKSGMPWFCCDGGIDCYCPERDYDVKDYPGWNREADSFTLAVYAPSDNAAGTQSDGDAGSPASNNGGDHVGGQALEALVAVPVPDGEPIDPATVVPVLPQASAGPSSSSAVPAKSCIIVLDSSDEEEVDLDDDSAGPP